MTTNPRADSSGVVTLTGDIQFCTRIAERRRALGGRDSSFESVLTELQGSGLVIASVEMPLSHRGYRVPKFANLRSDPALADDLRSIGVDVVTLANNHTMDYGPEAMADTLAAYDGAGIACCGAGADIEAAFAPVWRDVGGARVGVLSAACTVPVESEAAAEKPGIAAIHVGFSFEADPNLMSEQPGTMPVVHSWVKDEDKNTLCSRVRAMKGQGDVVIVAMHWGVPTYWLSPSQGVLAEYQQPLAHALIEAGADVILGNHPHGLYPVEVYQGKPIFYAMGNFIHEYGDLAFFMGQEAILVHMTLDAPRSIELVPLHVDAEGMPRRATANEAAHVFEMLDSLSKPFGTTIEVLNDRGFLVA